MKLLTPDQLIECIKLEILWKAVARFWELFFENNPELRNVDTTTICKKDWDSWCTSLQRGVGRKPLTEEDWILYWAGSRSGYSLKDYQYTDRDGEVQWGHANGNMWELFIRPFSAKVTRSNTRIYLYEVRQFLQRPESWRMKFFNHDHLRWNDLDDQISRAQERVTELMTIKARKEQRKQKESS